MMQFDTQNFDLASALDKCLSKDRFRLEQRLKKLLSAASLDQDALIEALHALDESQSRVEFRRRTIGQIEYPDLPVSNEKEAIKTLIQEHQVIIIAGATGSGKTTQIPKMCLELGRGTRGLIGHTQPRRLAARSVATRISEELQSPFGEKVGYKVRFTDHVSDKTLIKLMTDGILLAEIQQDKFLNAYDTIIIDEAHERSLNIDFLLGYLKRILPKRPDLKLIITSATIDPERFAKHFNDAPIIEVSGRTYPVEIRYKDPVALDTDDTLDLLGLAVDELMHEAPGDILVFLSGERDIRDAADYLRRRQLRNTEILPLFARLSTAEQQRIFSPHGGRRIILATNVAETSLTVPGIKYVIDSGVARISRYNPRTKVQRLPIEVISQASANQRSGRCGRLSDGIAIRLYAEEDFVSRPAFTDPEIVRTHLSSVILQMLLLGLGELSRFPFIQAPDQSQITDGIKLLEELQAIVRKKGKLILTPLGRKMAKIPLDPRYSRILFEADKYNAVREVLVIVAGLSVQDPRERPQNLQQQADQAHAEFLDKDSDFISLLNLYNAVKEQQSQLSNNQLRAWCKKRFINFQRMREWQDIVSQARKLFSSVNLSLSNQAADYEKIHRSMLVGFLSQLGMKGTDSAYQGSRNTQFYVFPGSGVFKQAPKWLMSAELVETSKLYARQVARIAPEWCEHVSEHVHKKHYSEPFWSKKKGATQAHLSITLFGLPIVTQRIVDYSKIDPVIAREFFIREGLVQDMHNMRFDFVVANRAQIDAVENLEKKARAREFLVDEQVIYDFYDAKIPEDICNVASFSKWWRKKSQQEAKFLHFNYDDLLKQDANKLSEQDFPDKWQQNSLLLPLEYEFDPTNQQDGVNLIIPISILNQVENKGFDWLVPGMRYELLLHLIKSLPKALRRNYVPAPNYASACLDLDTHDKRGQWRRITEAFAEKLFRMTGNKVQAEDFDSDNLPPYLRMNFVCIDDKKNVLGMHKDLNALKHSLSNKLKSTIEKVAAKDDIEQQNIQTWQVEEIPKIFKRQHSGLEITAYPGLEFKNKQVNLSLFDRKEAADHAHRQGLVALIKQNIPSPIKHLQQHLPNKAKLSLYFNPFGQVSVLIDDIVMASIASLCQQKVNLNDVRKRDSYEHLLEHCRANLNDRALDIALNIEKGLATANAISKHIKGAIPLPLINHVKHIKQYLDKLVFKGFVQYYGADELDDWNRYLQSLLMRTEKLKIDANRDRLNQLELSKAEEALDACRQRCAKNAYVPEQLSLVEKMIEEFKVSLFSQQLGTKFPISLKRIKNKIHEIENQDL